MKEMKCPRCFCPMELKNLHKQKTFKGIDIEYTCRAYVCQECGLEVGTVQTAGDTQRAVADAYRARKGLLTGREIKALREVQGMTQNELAEDLQVGIASIKRWESGAVQSESMDKLLRLRLLGNHGSSCNGNREIDLPRIKLVAEALEMTLGRKLLKEGDRFLFLAKYLWYADMLAFRKLGRGLTGASYAAMPYGPQLNNYQDLLDSVKKSDSNDAEPLNEEELGVVRQVARRFPKDRDVFDAAHQERAWKESRIGALISYASAYELTELTGGEV
jgi:putative zinc finger/helix-turn-helix YgiT family protein